MNGWSCSSARASARNSGAAPSPSCTAIPASQAALARLDPQDPRTAQRFELYCDGVELANGFHELAAAAEQRARFEADNAERRRRGLPEGALDERLLAALAAGLPDCAGVALGFDRTADAGHGGRPHRGGAGVSDRARLTVLHPKRDEHMAATSCHPAGR